MTRRLAVSAVNLTEGGTLTILRDFVNAACEVLPSEWEIVVFVHDTHLLDSARARLIAIPYAKKSWLLRLWVEWHVFRRHARNLRPDLWISLHDVSPNVGDVPQVVYCHNANPFFPVRLRDVIFQPKQLAFRFGYGWVYRVNLRRNRAVVVQQAWLRDAFRSWVGSSTQIVVAHPRVPESGVRHATRDRTGHAVFVYPTLARPFKNLELIGRALEYLEDGAADDSYGSGESVWSSEVILTIDGAENRYARWLKRRFGKIRSLRFIGRQSREQMQRLYSESDCLLFPSLMETWGLPISEAKQYKLAMFVADLPYARETVGTYDRVDFIDIDDARGLARKLMDFQEGRHAFAGAVAADPAAPFVRDWPTLVRALVEIAGAN